MKAKPETTITADGILKALSNGAKSMTAVAKALGYKSGSSGVLKKLISIVPDLEARLAINTPLVKEASKAGKKSAKIAPSDKKPSVKKTAGTVAYPIPDITPFRHSPENPSGYSMCWAILHAHPAGISKSDLTAKYVAWSGKPLKNCQFDVHVVCSPREDGSCHRSAGKASQSYWVERQNDWYRLHLIGEKK